MGAEIRPDDVAPAEKDEGNSRLLHEEAKTEEGTRSGESQEGAPLGGREQNQNRPEHRQHDEVRGMSSETQDRRAKRKHRVGAGGRQASRLA